MNDYPWSRGEPPHEGPAPPPDEPPARPGEARRRPPRITARAENHLRDIEWRIARLGAFVASGQVDRSLIVERLGVAIELARLNDEGLP
jgi:hypothetical protein